MRERGTQAHRSNVETCHSVSVGAGFTTIVSFAPDVTKPALTECESVDPSLRSREPSFELTNDES